ncbi:MAG: Wzz/FepE/Etk N-terminal domain-containing protein [Verrucomicrobia bacterium]|nr:Wzz/FepE/Etk N-terminal domain-containing protein [Verrucomicrobiota bacterium]
MSRKRAESDHQAIAFSERLYERLLAAYPEGHRREYGPAMAQLFRDQCRDAWGAARGWGLTWLWLRVLPDLVKTSVLEHISTLKERKTMLERLGTLLRPRSAPRFAFIAVFAAVFLLVATTSTLITFILPEAYCSTARMRVRQQASEVTRNPGMPAPVGPYDPYFLKAQFEIIKSQAILGRVIDELNLNQVWGKKYTGSDALKPAESLALLQARFDLRPVRNSDLIEIRAFSENPSEAAALANAIAKSYREYRAGIARADIVDNAVPGLRPVRPNKPLNIALGIALGLMIGSVAGLAVAWVVARFGRKSRGLGTPSDWCCCSSTRPALDSSRFFLEALPGVPSQSFGWLGSS